MQKLLLQIAGQLQSLEPVHIRCEQPNWLTWVLKGSGQRSRENKGATWRCRVQHEPILRPYKTLHYHG